MKTVINPSAPTFPRAGWLSGKIKSFLAEPSSSLPSPRRLPTPSLRTMLMLVIPVLVGTVGLFLYLVSGRYVGTDNAFIGAQKVLITPEVSGKVVSITVVEGQPLR